MQVEDEIICEINGEIFAALQIIYYICTLE